ncbi:MAG: permease-like cell division protein FtsX [Candidatus Eisenbacteria sp.]|nr:permease-like cell division protein FtsX [Candidatus Eisenbacteria bacterium]
MRAFFFFIQEGWVSLQRNLAASFAAVTALGAVLFVLLLFLLLSHNVMLLAGRLEDRKGLSVFLASDVTAERIEELRHHFTSFPEVRDLRFVSQSEALDEVEADLGMEGTLEALGENPLPDAFLVLPALEASHAEGLAALATEMEAYEGVEDVLYGQRWIAALDQGLHVVRRVNALTGGLATIAIILVLANTLRLLVLMREEQLVILRLIGATHAFLRAPFLAAGLILCLIGALLSQLILYAGFVTTRSFMPGLRFLPSEWLILFLLGVVAVGLLGSFLTVEASIRSLERRGGGGDA